MNILIPLAGDNEYKDDQIIPIIQIDNKTLIEYVLENINIDGDNNYIFIIKDIDADRFYLDSVLKLIKPSSNIVSIKGEAQGQLCSCLLGIEHLKKNESLLIVNGDQYIFEDIKKIIGFFETSNADGGIVTFNSVHPKWSFVRLDEDDETVIETSEKRPISRNACVGIYYFKNTLDFIESAKDVIRKDTLVDGNFYVSSTYNEMILKNKQVISYNISNNNFYSLDSQENINTFFQKLLKEC